ncbi:MAG TPA: phosphoglycerate mutase, partial [Synergistaceae bacterium]|nr:phosphoglycerate mutase [Synergistaceae bacterium]
LFRGRADFPLNERGVRQAGELAEALRPWEPAVVYTSPLLRARATAEAIAAACGAELRVDEGMNNMALGVWEGRRKTEVAKERPDLWRLWMENPEELVVDG